MKTKLTLSILLLTLFFSFEGLTQIPSWQWARSAGGTYSDFSNSVTVDNEGNSYITGYFTGASATFGSITLINDSIGSEDIFIAKYDPSGNVVWAKSAGGILNENSKSISVDANGNVYITGYFYSPALAFDTITLTNIGQGDIFIAKYDSIGNIAWAHNVGGANTDIGFAIATDGSGNSYITGSFHSPTLVFGSDTIISNGSDDVFIAKYDFMGNTLWAKDAGGSALDGGENISIATSGHICVSGVYTSSSITFGNITLLGGGAFLVNYDSSGNAIWANTAPANSYCMNADLNGNSYVSGGFNSNTITFGTITLTKIGPYTANIFVVKYDNTGNAIWAKNVGAEFVSQAYGISSDISGNLYLTGKFQDSITFDNTTLVCAGTYNIFIVKYDVSGNVSWAISLPGNGWDYGMGIQLTTNGYAYLTGTFSSSTLTFGSTTLVSTGQEIYLAKFGIGTSIAEQNPTNNLTLYPNPATDYITINTGINKKRLITISDITGKIIYNNSDVATEKLEVNTKDFSDGIYFVRIQTADFVETKKLVVAK